MSYRHFTAAERYQIQAFIRSGLNNADIARQLGKPDASNLSREIRRNGGRDRYDAERAEQRYRRHLQDKGRPRQRWHQVFDEAAVPLL